jgi:nitrous oxidase accessory protein NosD
MDEDGTGETPYRSNTLVDALLWTYPHSKFLLASPAFQLLALAEREFPVITYPKAVDASPLMTPPMADWESLLARYPGEPPQYYLEMQKLPHLPGEDD